jgi:hypothetical protein
VSGAPEEEAYAERLAALARALAARGDGVLADLAAIRAEVDRIARLREAGNPESALLAPLRQALGAAGLAEVVPEAAPLAAIQAAIARLHGLVAALVVTRARRRPR